MTDREIKDYLENAGVLFTVTLIDFIRDGGTKMINTTKGKFYIHKETGKIHSDYPPNEENLIIDNLLINYLIARIENYILRKETTLGHDRSVLKEILKNNSDN